MKILSLSQNLSDSYKVNKNLNNEKIQPTDKTQQDTSKPTPPH